MNHLSEQLRAAREGPPLLQREPEVAAVLDASTATQLNVCRCPLCAGPMIARNGPRGPYFHCLCADRSPKQQRSARPGPSETAA